MKNLQNTNNQDGSKFEIFKELFSQGLELLPQVNEVYELELAYLESQILSKDELIKNGAFFSMVDNITTRHFLMCKGEALKVANYSSSRLKSFFQNNQFKTGYATHGLFPYRGKFHPQMIKALINIIKVKKGDTILDPMMGSGTVLIEAKLMGINSIGIDASPFCQFITQAKIDALSVDLNRIKRIPPANIYDYFTNKYGNPECGSKTRKNRTNLDLSAFNKAQNADEATIVDMELRELMSDKKLYNFLLLSFLDSAGYSQRSKRKKPFDQFKSIFERYIFVSEKIQNVLAGFESELGSAKSLVGDARALEIPSNSMDGIIFSPPYSFAIDYIDNDSFHLSKLNVNIEELKDKMVGLRGKSKIEKYHLYLEDMKKIIRECYRVLKDDKYCTIVVGTNRNQIANILKKDPEEVKGIDEVLIDLCIETGFKWEKRIERQITGMANTMRTESIVMLIK